MTITTQQIIDLPDMNWDDDGRRVKFVFDGVSQEGVLVYSDYFFGGCDEFPMFEIKLQDGTNIGVFEVVWEYVE